MAESTILLEHREHDPVLMDGSDIIVLPFDILFIVWEYLKGDKPSLSSCALVCRSWAFPCQQRIFEHVVVNLLIPLHWGFFPPIDVAKGMPPLSPRLSGYVKHLTIQPTRDPNGHFPLPKSVLTVDIIDIIMRNLTNLDSLSIQHMDLRRSTVASFDPSLFVHKKPFLSRLHFENAYIGAEAFRLLTLFSEIKELCFSFCGTVLLPEEEIKIERAIHAVPEGLRVSAFRTANADLDSVMKYFTRLFHMPSLKCFTEIFQTLAFGYIEYDQCMMFLQNPLLTLSEIRLDFSLWSHICMSSLDWNKLNRSLECHPSAIVRFSVPIDYSTENFSLSVDRMNQLPSQITHLSLVIWYPNPQSITEVENWNQSGAWKAWNRVLGRRPYLKEVSVLLCLISEYGNGDEESIQRQRKLFDDMKHLARAEFRGFLERGVLRVQDFDHHRCIYPDSQFMVSMESQCQLFEHN